MCGVHRKVHFQNEYLRGTLKITKLASKIQTVRLKWFGHVLIRDNEYVGKESDAGEEGV